MRNPLKDPQTGDCILAYMPEIAAIHIVHRRDNVVWFASATFPIRSAYVDVFSKTMEMTDAGDMNHLTELQKWPEPHSKIEVPNV